MLELEREKLELDKRRLRNEEKQASGWRALVTPIGIAIPLVVAAVTLVLTAHREAVQDRRDFELKAAEIVMQEGSPLGTYNKARALKELFPGRLPEDFAASFHPAQFTARRTLEGRRSALFSALLAHPGQEADILRVWGFFRPVDKEFTDKLIQQLR